jgi:hypothetical protein
VSTATKTTVDLARIEKSPYIQLRMPEGDSKLFLEVKARLAED